jgi:hypothetical protein
MKRMMRWIVGVGLAVALALPATSAWAATPAATIPPNGVAAVAGTCHQFVADEQGVLHYVGDSRALTGHAVDWASRTDMTAEEIKALPRGDLWLSAGMVKLGDAIYLAKWETDEVVPRLLQIQSIDDLELFGVTPTNYGATVLAPAAWEQQFGMEVAALQRGALDQATFCVPAPMTPPEPETES